MNVWKGGECPVYEDLIVEVVYRAGGNGSEVRAGDLDWGHTGGGSDILFYRAQGVHIETAEKQPRYLNDNGSDWIDECAESLTPEEFRGAMKFTIGKYLKRLGKKDATVAEVGKISDYAARWLEVEKSR